MHRRERGRLFETTVQRTHAIERFRGERLGYLPPEVAPPDTGLPKPNLFSDP